MSRRDYFKHLGFVTATAIVASKITNMAQSNEPTTDQMNKAIAFFDKIWERFKPIDPTTMSNDLWCSYLAERGELKYHTSWDWLMPIWESFRDLEFADVGDQLRHSELKSFISQAICFWGIDNAFKRIFDAIQWYNQQKQK